MQAFLRVYCVIFVLLEFCYSNTVKKALLLLKTHKIDKALQVVKLSLKTMIYQIFASPNEVSFRIDMTSGQAYSLRPWTQYLVFPQEKEHNKLWIIIITISTN